MLHLEVHMFNSKCCYCNLGPLGFFFDEHVGYSERGFPHSSRQWRLDFWNTEETVVSYQDAILLLGARQVSLSFYFVPARIRTGYAVNKSVYNYVYTNSFNLAASVQVTR